MDQKGYPQSPFGRTSSADFQIELSEKFHCVIQTEIPRFPFSNDFLTIWKRTNFIQIFDDDENLNDNKIPASQINDKQSPSKKKQIKNSDDDDNDVDDDDDDDDDEKINRNMNLWADIPKEEMIENACIYAPCFQHLFAK